MPYQPSANGLIERVNRKILDTLKLTITPDLLNWDDHLENVQYLLNTRIHKSINMSPFKALYGFHPRQANEMNINRYQTEIKNNPLESRINNKSVIIQKLKEALQKTNLEMQTNQHKNASKISFKAGDYIYLRKNVLGTGYKVEPHFEGPFKIIENIKGNKFQVKNVNTGHEQMAHADKMKLFKRDGKDDENEDNDLTTNTNNPKETTHIESRKSVRLTEKPKIYFEQYF